MPDLVMTAMDMIEGGIRQRQLAVLLPVFCWQMLSLAREGISASCSHHMLPGPREGGLWFFPVLGPKGQLSPLLHLNQGVREPS